jgi:septal ring factor EnvC (AmiA/AmiB activator)
MNMKPIQTRYLITIQRPMRWVLGLLAVIALVAASIWLSYERGRHVAGFDASDANQVIDSLQMEIETLQADLAESQRQAAMLERNSKIEDDTTGQLKKTLTEAQNEVLELKKELAFYKSIVAPEQGKPTLVVQTIQLKKDVAGDYDYKIMVSQQGRNDRFARGTMEVNIEGTNQGAKQVLALTDVSEDASKPMNFGLKYFQNFTGKLKLPEGFVAKSMRVKLKPSSKTLDSVDEKFPWDDLTAGE